MIKNELSIFDYPLFRVKVEFKETCLFTISQLKLKNRRVVNLLLFVRPTQYHQYYFFILEQNLRFTI